MKYTGYENRTEMSALRMAADEYKSVTERINNTTKTIFSLLICLGGIVTAVAALFTAYCICMPKNSYVDYILFAIDILFIITFAIDYRSITYRRKGGGCIVRYLKRLLGCNKDEETENEIADGYIGSREYDNRINAALRSIGNVSDEQLRNIDFKVLNNEIDMYRHASKDALKILHVKRRSLRASCIFTFISILSLAISVVITTAI